MRDAAVVIAGCMLLVTSRGAAEVPAAVTAQVCRDRKECSIVQEYDAGRASTGEPLRVFKLTSKPRWEEPSLRDVTCERFEYVAWKGPLDATGKTQSLFVDCNDGYGPAKRGADEVAIRDGVFVHTRRSGAVHWETDEVIEIRLDPWALVREKKTDTWDPKHHVRTTLWDWDKFSGLTRWTLPVCAAQKQQLAARIAQEGSATLTFAYNPVPLVTGQDPSAAHVSPFVGDEWKTADLTGCSTLVTSDASRGFLVSGAPSTADDASLRVVATAKSIFVQVEDDAFVNAEARVADVLTVSIAEDEQLIRKCYARAAKVQQIAIEVRAGRVTANLPADMQMDFVQTGKVLRVRLDAKARKSTALAVSYADSDDGLTLERTIATADLRFGDPTNIGPAQRISNRERHCAVVDGKLQPVVETLSTEPLGPGI